MHPAESWDMIRARQRRATISKTKMKTIYKQGILDKRTRVYQAFGAFLLDFVRDLNHLYEGGWTVLVEGPRDVRALRRLGYRGTVATVAAVGRKGPSAFGETRKVVILTDLDHEGALLASRYVRVLAHEGIRASLGERRRLKAASRGVFLHVENLGRFGQGEE
jgi:5S rRNA maturation endonuclease (ribonuclease M5)